MNEVHACCAGCGEEGEGIFSLKACTSCMLVKYCNATCQRNHWATHKKECKQRAAELHDEALFKDPPAKEDCPICFLPMPENLICCISLPPATISSVPIYDFVIANNEELANWLTGHYYECCGKSICRGCFYSFCKSENIMNCPYCKTEKINKTEEETNGQLMKRLEVNDAGAICELAIHYYQGNWGLQQDEEKAMELYNRAAALGSSRAHFHLGMSIMDYGGGNLKKAKFHYEAAAVAGHEGARFNIGIMELESGKKERAVKHWTIAASAGCFRAMHKLKISFEGGYVSRNEINSTLEAYNNSCVEMRSEAREAYIHAVIQSLNQ